MSYRALTSHPERTRTHVTLRNLLLAGLTALLIACGGGGGGGSGDNGGDGGGGGSDGGDDDTGATLPLDLTLAEGEFWEFFWTSETTSFAQGSGTSGDVDVGRYRVTLGQSTLIQGIEAFPLTISGDTNGGEFAPRWTHFAVADDGSLLGSDDGASLETVYDAATDSWTGGGTFVDFGDEAITVTPKTFPGVYNSLSAISAGREFEDARCEVILGQTICDDDSTEFSEEEFYKEGVGPIGYALRIQTTDDGGGFFTSNTIEETIELIQTSFAATDGSVFSLPPWEEVASLPVPRSRHSAVVLDGLIYVLGGITNGSFTNSVVIYDPTTDSWSSGESMPNMTSAPAVAIEGRIYMPLDTERVQVFDPNAIAGNRWSVATPVNNPGVGLLDAAFHNDTAFGFGEILVGTNINPVGTGSLSFGAYDPDENQWLFSGNVAQSFNELLRFSVEVVGDTMYVIGGFGRRSSFDDRGAVDNILEFDIATDSWTTTGPGRLNLARDDHASAVLDGLIYVFGGAPVSCSSIDPNNCNRGNPFRESEVFDPSTSVSTNLAQMFTPREEFSAVALDGQIYVIGGSSGDDDTAAVERFTPE